MKSLYDQASIIPGRSMTRSKAPGRFWPVGSMDPRTHYSIAGDGATIIDAQGNRYIDMLCGLGAISLGYRSDYIPMPLGTCSLPSMLEISAAQAVLDHVAPWATSARFLKTGSEATHAAYRIAKAATGRGRVLVGDWAYHGWHEWSAEASKYPHGDRWLQQEMVGDVAAVFVEPHRWEPVDVEWLKFVRAFCDRIGALLVFDSMIYGGRWALGGASEFFGIEPDMECFGKAFGNGHAVAFVVGKKALAEHGEIVSGTFSGDIVGLSAALDTIEAYRADGVIETLWAIGRRLAAGLDSVIPPSLGVREGQPVHQRVRFHNPSLGSLFSLEMATRAVLWHPDVVNVCAAHTPDLIDRVVEAAEQSAKALLNADLPASV